MKINRRWLGTVVNLDWTNILKRATRHYRAQPGRQEPRQAKQCQAQGSQKGQASESLGDWTGPGPNQPGGITCFPPEPRKTAIDNGKAGPATLEV